MTHQQYRGLAFLQVLDSGEALVLKFEVTHGESLVNEYDVAIHVNRYAETQSANIPLEYILTGLSNHSPDR